MLFCARCTVFHTERDFHSSALEYDQNVHADVPDENARTEGIPGRRSEYEGQE